MINQAKKEQALLSLHRLLIITRFIAHEEGAAKIAEILDTAEYLVLLMQDEEDKTDIFREHLVDLGNRVDPDLTSVVEVFDSEGQ